MLLTLDVGNTNIVAGCHPNPRQDPKAAERLQSWRISTHPIGTSDEFRAKLGVLLNLENRHLKDLEAVVISSVVPQATAMLRGAFPGTPIHVIDHSWPFSFAIEPKPASGIGADRLVNAEAVVREYGGPAIIVDSGTATTLCAVTRDGTYLGGAIMPGIELSIETLAKKAAKLFTVELSPPAHAIGRNTEEALRSGILLGYASMIDGMVRRFKAELGEPQARVVATGGVSALLRGICTELDHFEPELTLRGILYLYQAFQGGRT